MKQIQENFRKLKHIVKVDFINSNGNLIIAFKKSMFWLFIASLCLFLFFFYLKVNPTTWYYQ